MALKIEKIGKTDDYVYDISLDGTVVNAMGMNVMSNTDGFNFSLPDDDQFRYTKANPYIGKGLNRIVKKGVEYDGYWADVMEFNDLYMRAKNGLDVDEVIPASINVSRKNYIDLLDGGKVKKVGNTLKSRKMSGYLKSFIDSACQLLLNEKGNEFVELYYRYVDDIYNYRIPLKDIASKGKIKQKIEDYKKACNEVTKAGNKKSRQAWYELVIKENMKVELDDTIYYVNTGEKKSDSDVVHSVKYYVKGDDGFEVELKGPVKTKLLKRECEKKGLAYKLLKEKEKKEILKPFIIREEDVITLNCEMVPMDVVTSEDVKLCSDCDIAYNVDKYMDQFNNRVRPLLVCFHSDIRDSILVKNPADRQFFTEKECELVSGYPMRVTDQDTYEALMTPEKKEIEFWLSIGERPPFVDECGIDWDTCVNEYLEAKKIEDEEIFKLENGKYLELLDSITQAEREKFIEDGVIPSRFASVVEMDSDLHFYFVNIPGVTPSTGGSVIDDFIPEIIVDEADGEYESVSCEGEELE